MRGEALPHAPFAAAEDVAYKNAFGLQHPKQPAPPREERLKFLRVGVGEGTQRGTQAVDRICRSRQRGDHEHLVPTGGFEHDARQRLRS